MSNIRVMWYICSMYRQTVYSLMNQASCETRDTKMSIETEWFHGKQAWLCHMSEIGHYVGGLGTRWGAALWSRHTNHSGRSVQFHRKAIIPPDPWENYRRLVKPLTEDCPGNPIRLTIELFGGHWPNWPKTFSGDFVSWCDAGYLT